MANDEVSLTLTSPELSRLEAAITVLASPLAFPSVEAWGNAAMQRVSELLVADQAFFALPVDSTVHVHAYGARTGEAARAYEQYFWQTDVALTERRRALGLEVYHRDMLYRPGELARDELHNDWCVPHRLFDTLGMGVQVTDAPIPAGIHVYHDSAGGAAFGERGVALMRLLLPAFKAGVQACRALASHREALASVVDDLDEALAVFDAETGRSLHESATFVRLLAADPDAPRLRFEVARIAQAAAAAGAGWPGAARARRSDLCGALSQEVRTARDCYLLRATLASAGVFGPVRAAFVVLDRAPSEPSSSDTVLRARHRLTAREAQVARLLAVGRSNRDIAAALGVTEHTARHHSESVLTKLDVHSRAAVGPKLRE